MPKSPPLNVVINPPGEQRVYPGSLSELVVVVTNTARNGLVVEVSLELPATIRSWCPAVRESFNLDQQRSQEVIFKWQIPVQALPATYHYDLVVDSPTVNVLTAPLRFSLKLTVLTPIQAAGRSSDPTFLLKPPTASIRPALVQAGQPFDLIVVINNRSNRVDEFRLICPDLDEDWYTVRYPEGIEAQGAILGGSKLSLNPNTQGQLQLQLHPPATTLAGKYSPTVRILSAVNPTLLLQDIFYLQIPPLYSLDVQLQTVLGKVRQKAGRYDVLLNNRGNTIRELQLQVQTADEVELCHYRLERSQVRLPPSKTITVGLQVKPMRQQSRPWFGAGRSINFGIELIDVDQHPLPQNLPLVGTLIWAARPWWQLLLIALAILLGIAGLILLIWWLLFRPPSPPQIVSFTPDESRYTYGQEVTMSWTVGSIGQLQRLSLVGNSSQGQRLTDKREFMLTNGQVPPNLQNLCLIDGLTLSCRNVSTGAKKPGDYIFQLSLFGKPSISQPLATQNSSLVTIAPPPQPSIATVGTNRSQYQTGEQIELTFQLGNPLQVHQLQIFRSGVIIQEIAAEELGKFCQNLENQTATCQVGLPTDTVGSYIYAVAAIDQTQATSGPISAPNTTTIAERKIPLKVSKFTINGSNISPITIRPGERTNLEWQVTGKEVSVTITGLSGEQPARGQAQLKPSFLPNTQQQIVLTAKDVDGNTTTNELIIQVIPAKPPSKPQLVKPKIPKDGV